MISALASKLRILLRRHPFWIAFFVLTLWITAIRWNLRYEPLNRDISAYAVTGRELLTGRTLYSDVWDHKPPGIHLIFAGATALVGPGVSAVFLVNVVFSLIVAGGLMSAGHRIAGSPGAIVAGVLWAVVGADLGLQANQPNVELPMNACMAWALAASLSGRSRSTGNVARAMGVLTACGLLLKPVVAAPLGFLAVVDAVERWRQGGATATLAFLRRWVVAIFVGVAPVMTWCVLRAGREAVWEALVRYNLAYGQGDLLTNLFGLTRIGTHLPMSSVAVIGLLALAGFAGLFQMNAPERQRILAVLVGSAFAVAAPGRFYPHYFQLLLPSLVLAAVIGVTKALSHPGVRRFVAIAVLVVLGTLQFQSLRLPPDEWSRRKFGDVFLDEIRLADYLKTHVKPGEFFWQLGPQPGLYLLTETVPASGVIYDYPLLRNSPVRHRLAGRVIAELKKNRPQKVAVRVDRERRVDSRIGAWIRQHYRLIEDEGPVDGYRLWTLSEPKPLGGQMFPEPYELPILVDGFEDGTTTAWSQYPTGHEKRTTPSPTR